MKGWRKKRKGHRKQCLCFHREKLCVGAERKIQSEIQRDTDKEWNREERIRLIEEKIRQEQLITVSVGEQMPSGPLPD